MPGSGIEAYTETDYSSTDPDRLDISRYYRSSRSAGTQSSLWPYDGKYGGWTLSLQTGIFTDPTATLRQGIKISRHDGSLNTFYATVSSTGMRTWNSFNSGGDVLTEQQSSTAARLGWQYKVALDDSLESYDAAGKLLTIKKRNGWVTTFIYSSSVTPVSSYVTGTTAPQLNKLISIRNSFGREVKFVYDANGRISQILPPGAVKDSAAGSPSSPIRYSYDETANLGTTAPQSQLTGVVWQDGRIKHYQYEDPRHAQALTGITDEAGVRIATYAYDDQRRVVDEHKAGGADHLQFAYGSPTAEGLRYTTVTDYSGANGSATSRTYTLKSQGGVLRPSSVTAPCPLCSSTQANTNYDYNNNVIKTIGHDGATTFISYDSRGREIERAVFDSTYQSATVRPALSLATSVTSTQWHATWNLPVQIAEPRSLTALTYDAAGNLTGKSQTATTDATGAAKFTAIKTGNLYATGWSYNAQSLVGTSVESTNGVEKLRFTFVYDELGNVSSIRNVTDNVTATMSSYDANGRLLVGKTDAGIAIGYQYAPRGFLTKKTVSGKTIAFTQNTIGLTTDVSTPDNQSIRYTYDANHRLTSVLLNGAVITPQMLASADYPQTYVEGHWLALKSNAREGIEKLITTAYAQLAIPGVMRNTVVSGSSRAMPGQPEYDPATDMMTMQNFSKENGVTRRIAEKLARSCECKPDGGYDKPFFSEITKVHLTLSGHLSPMYSDKSYFLSTEKVAQGLVDEIVAKDSGRGRAKIDTRVTVVSDMGRTIGMVASPNGFLPTSWVTLVYEKENCLLTFRPRNEVVTMYPSAKPK